METDCLILALSTQMTGTVERATKQTQHVLEVV